MSETLKPCPFCGGEASVKCEVLAGMFVRGYWVSCDNNYCNENIECSTYAFDTKVDAIAAWNRRAAVTDEQFAVAVHDGRTWKVVDE